MTDNIEKILNALTIRMGQIEEDIKRLNMRMEEIEKKLEKKVKK